MPTMGPHGDSTRARSGTAHDRPLGKLDLTPAVDGTPDAAPAARGAAGAGHSVTALAIPLRTRTAAPQNGPYAVLDNRAARSVL
jgi:hypothetical protein